MKTVLNFSSKNVLLEKNLLLASFLFFILFGRDLKWNPHIHCLVTEGAIKYLLRYFNRPAMAQSRILYYDDSNVTQALCILLITKVLVVLFTNLIIKLYTYISSYLYVSLGCVSQASNEQCFVTRLLQFPITQK